MAGVLVFSELDAVAAELLTVARELGMPVSAAVLGPGAGDRAGVCHQFGAAKVYVNEGAALSDLQPDVYAAALANVVAAADANVVLVGSTKRGKELAGRLAQRLECGSITDATGLAAEDDRLLVTRYALGGNTIASEAITTDVQVIAVVPHSVEASPARVSGETVSVDLALPEPRMQIVERKAKSASAVDIEAADTLVCVGKGLAKKEDLALIEALAETLGGEIGCTRALSADYHWLGEERMVGISGKITKPDLMVSVGISGQIQHTVGVLGSKLIVAINKDKNAPIFKVADYGIVGDLYEVVPKLTERLGR